MDDDEDVREDGGSNGCFKMFLVTLVVLVALVVGVFWWAGDFIRSQFTAAPPVSVAQASLQGLKEQNRLVAFEARFNATVTSKQTRFLGLTAKKTMIMPGTVRYEVDLSQLSDRDLSWDAGSNTLTVTIPNVEPTKPQVDIDNISEYREGGFVMSVTNAEDMLDEANRKAGQAELVRQAGSPVPMRLARDAARRAIERSFVLPLRAAKIDANVTVQFRDEAGKPKGEIWDQSRRPEDVLANKQ